MSATHGHHHHEHALDLTTMYLESAVAGAHSIGLRLGHEHDGSRKGTLSLDPNHCGLNPWGDRTWCTRMAIRMVDVTTTRMRTLDPNGHHRVLHVVKSEAFEAESANLIEYPSAGLWYLVYQRKDGASWVVPLFDAKLFTADPAGTIAMRYGVPMREVLHSGDLDAMKLEVAVVKAALDAATMTRAAATEDKHVTEVRAVLGELEAAIAKLES